jgi:CRP-like cAMP-binding protein
MFLAVRNGAIAMENFEILSRVFFFQELTPDQLAKIAAITKREKFRIGQKIFEAGSDSRAFYLIRSGAVMVKKGAMVLATPQAGDCIGEISFVDRGKRSATVAAIEETELLAVPFAELDALFIREPQLAAAIYKTIATILSRRLREMDETVNTRFQPVKF